MSLSTLRVQKRRLTLTPRAAGSNQFTHCVIGGGVVGLATARQLAKRSQTSTVLLERHRALGTETSSRNSEVIHAGLYYPRNSLKTELCLKGRGMLYELCARYGIPFRKTGKWIMAQDEHQFRELEKIHAHARSLGVPMSWITPAEANAREPAVRALAGVLESPETGIVDSHALMTFLHGAFEEEGGDVALGACITNVVPLAGGGEGYKVSVEGPGGEVTDITADVVVNAAGLGAVGISNMVLPEERHMKAYFCKGTYFSYSASKPKVNTLLYPTPIPGFGGLGTHLTLDMAGKVRFGPDVEWVDDPSDLAPNESRMAAAVVAIKTYLPGLDEVSLGLDYCGMRPKITPQGQEGVGQVDFIIREEEGFDGFINLLGVESPGLTSALAIGEKVESILYGRP